MKNKNKTSAASAEPVNSGRGKPGNQSHTHETVPAAVPEPIKTGRGGLRDYSEAQAKTVQRVRGEFLSDTFKPKITITHRTVTFNTAFVNFFPECQRVSIRIDASNFCLVVEPTFEFDKNGLKFVRFKDGKNIPRTCTAKDFCSILFDFMKWNPNAKYRILAVFPECRLSPESYVPNIEQINIDALLFAHKTGIKFPGESLSDKKIAIFNLAEALEMFSEILPT